MEKAQKIRNRIRSISGTRKITKAMEMIASSKIRKAQSRVLEARAFTASIEEVITDIACFSGPVSNPFLKKPENDNTVLVLGITADRGLCGGYNSNIIRLIEKTIKILRKTGKNVKLDIIGTRGKNYFKYAGYEMEKVYENLSDYPKFLDAREIAKDIISRYLSGQFGKVLICYTRFKNPAEQVPTVIQLLPIPISFAENENNIGNNIANNTNIINNTNIGNNTDNIENVDNINIDNIDNIDNVSNIALFSKKDKRFDESTDEVDQEVVLTKTETSSYISEKIQSVGQVKIGDKICRIRPEFVYDPSREEVLEALLPQYIYTIMYSALLESTASETGARMTAMRSASENAEEMIKDLVLMYHRARQQQITIEISEIMSGMGENYGYR